ncbi:peptidoglycan-binding domain-containing protein, partial [bacterium]|nr:peptidoglycan-binding domain-containing protein [bacterium]
ALSHVGELVRVCGTVTTASYMAASKRQPTYFNFGQPYPHHTFTALIWGENRHKFPRPPIQTFDGKRICVTGVVSVWKSKAQIIVSEPDQMELAEPTDPTQPAAGRAVLTDLEAIFVKALLEAYGEDANYGSGEWDQETVEAMSRFQEAMDIRPSGNPDPETLRAMAKRTLDLSDEAQERIIRLVLFQLAQRQE